MQLRFVKVTIQTGVRLTRREIFPLSVGRCTKSFMRSLERAFDLDHPLMVPDRAFAATTTRLRRVRLIEVNDEDAVDICPVA